MQMYIQSGINNIKSNKTLFLYMYALEKRNAKKYKF